MRLTESGISVSSKMNSSKHTPLLKSHFLLKGIFTVASYRYFCWYHFVTTVLFFSLEKHPQILALISEINFMISFTKYSSGVGH